MMLTTWAMGCPCHAEPMPSKAPTSASTWSSWAACGEKSSEVLNEIHAADDSPNRIVKRIIEDFLAFRRDIVPWTRVGEQAYLNARRLPFEFKLRT